MTSKRKQAEYDKSERERLSDAAEELKRIIKDLERNADRLQFKIEEIRNRRMEEDAT